MAYMTRIDESLTGKELIFAANVAVNSIRTYIAMLAAMVAENCVDWDEYVQVELRDSLIVQAQKAGLLKKDTCSQIVIKCNDLQIDQRKLLDYGLIFAHPLPGMKAHYRRRLSPFAITNFYIYSKNKKEIDGRPKIFRLLNDVYTKKKFLFASHRLLSEFTVYPGSYYWWQKHLLDLSSYRLSVLQPLLPKPLSLPFFSAIHDSIYIPEFGSIRVRGSTEKRFYRDAVKPLYDIEMHIQQIVLNFIKQEAIRRDHITHQNGDEADFEDIVDDDDGFDYGFLWSKAMSKSSAAEILSWARNTLDERIKQCPGDIMKITRQSYRFNCKNPAFGSLPVDFPFNETQKT